MIPLAIGGVLATVLGWVVGLAIGAYRGGRGLEMWGGASGGLIGFLAYRSYQRLWPIVTRRGEYGSFTVVEDPYYPLSLVAILGGAILGLIVISSRFRSGRGGLVGKGPSGAATHGAASRPEPAAPADWRRPAVCGMALLGAGSGLVSGRAWSYVVATRNPRGASPVLEILFMCAPGAIYGLAVALPFARRAPVIRTLQVVLTSLAGGLIFFMVYLVAMVTAFAFGFGLLAAGFIGSQMFGRVATLTLDLPAGRRDLRRYVLAGTVSAVAFLPHLVFVVNGPATPLKPLTGYLGFVVWQAVTAASLAPLLSPPGTGDEKPTGLVTSPGI